MLSSNWRKLQEVLNRGGGAELPAEGKGTTTAATRSGSVGVRVKRERKEQEEAEIEEGEGKGAETKAGDAWRYVGAGFLSLPWDFASIELGRKRKELLSNARGEKRRKR